MEEHNDIPEIQKKRYLPPEKRNDWSQPFTDRKVKNLSKTLSKLSKALERAVRRESEK